MKRREAALRAVAHLVREKGRSALYDLTGLAGGFPLQSEDLELLETYAGPALFEEQLELWGKKHLSGDKILALNRTSSGILATILALVKPGDEVLHYLPKKPSHPSIYRSTELVGASYREIEGDEDLWIKPNTSLLVITGSTMDHKIISLTDFKMALQTARENKVPVLVDDASGARIRTIVYDQPRAIDLGADMVITSTDKLMEGPRGGLMAGRSVLMDKIKTKAYQYGLEAQPPLIAGMARALEYFRPGKLLKAIKRKDKVYQLLKKDFHRIEKTPTGVMLTPTALEEEFDKRNIKTKLSADENAILLAMILLRKYHILTIPAVGMPGASPTLRMDMAASDAGRLDEYEILNSLLGSMNLLKEWDGNQQIIKEFLFE
jgi:L-seryl-tRNA(Ser) seleniumtransferase